MTEHMETVRPQISNILQDFSTSTTDRKNELTKNQNTDIQMDDLSGTADEEMRILQMKEKLLNRNISANQSDLDRQIAMLKNCECIKESEVRELCNYARDILLEESNI